MSAYIYRIDEGLQFCIKAIQDYAYSGFGGRGGKHGDIFWDNESYAIKHKGYRDRQLLYGSSPINWNL